MSRARGLEGEETAVSYLRKKGYVIRDRNVYSRFGEIDIVAEDADGVVVFCEVKAYRESNMVSPYEAITQAKLRRLRQTAQVYIDRHRLEDNDVRIDLIVVRDRSVSDHLTDVF